MAITPRTIFSSPASATIATISLLAFSAVGTLAYKVAQDTNPQPDQLYVAHTTESCSGIREVLGHDKAAWSQTDWLVYGSCFEQKNNSRMAAAVASQGLRYYPASESLYNMKGYHQIVLGDHAEAVDTLERGLRKIGTPSDGVMENNLAWAAMWAPREMNRDRARTLYKRSLRRNAESCETLHTGLWVEYAAAREAEGIERYQALKNFFELRRRYEPCQDRINDGQWQTLVEVVGAAVIFQDVDENLNTSKAVRTADSGSDGTEDLRRVTEKLRENYKGVSIDALCREAMPMGSTHHLCAESVSKSVSYLKQQEVKRDQPSIRILKDKTGRTGGASGCIRTN
ncbi:MAG: tetratricopeptide repeat protein [Persicimonas sp.]